MGLQQAPGCCAVEFRAAKKVGGREFGMFVGGGCRWFEAHAVAELCQASAQFGIFRDTKGRIEIAGIENCLAANAEIASDEESGVAELARLERELGKKKRRMIDPERKCAAAALRGRVELSEDGEFRAGVQSVQP